MASVFLTCIAASYGESQEQYKYTYYYNERSKDYYIPIEQVSYNNNISVFAKGVIAVRRCLIDSNGLFAPSQEIHVLTDVPEDAMDKFRLKYQLPFRNRRLVYEFRSGSIIPCCASEACHRMTPIPGLKVLRYSDYYYQPDLPPVYNKPLQFFPAWKDGFLAERPPVPKIAEMHESDLDMNDESVVPESNSHRYVPVPKRTPPNESVVYRRMLDHLYGGYYDRYGRFFWDAMRPPVPIKKLNNDEIMKMLGISRIDEAVYEFRSGSLIRGSINNDFYFIPEVGSIIESFRDYRHGFNARRIYNLPGRFVLKDK